MPRHHDPDSAISPALAKAASEILRVVGGVVDPSLGTDDYEGALKALLDAVGRRQMGQYLAGLGEQDAFKEGGAQWRVTLRDEKRVMTLFGWVPVDRPLFRAKRSGPTRCLVTERANLIEGKWTPRAARVASIATTELSFERTEEFFEQLGGMAPSKTLLLGLDRYLSELWEADREEHERRVRESSGIPPEAVAVAVSLDGVMVNMCGSDRAEKKARTKAAGRPAKGPTGYKEASVGVVSFYDSHGERLATWREGRMPEPDKATTKAWLRAELDRIRTLRPDLKVVAAADGYPNNWSFLETLNPDLQVVDFYHATQNLFMSLSELSGSATLETQEMLAKMKGTLLESKDGAKVVFKELRRLQARAGTLPKSMTKTGGKRQPTFFDRHSKRMNYAELREQRLPIGTGVTEGTCRFLVIDRLRRSGMAWSQAGGQAVLTLRSLAISNRFETAWQVLADKNNERLRPAA